MGKGQKAAPELAQEFSQYLQDEMGLHKDTTPLPEIVNDLIGIVRRLGYTCQQGGRQMIQ